MVNNRRKAQNLGMASADHTTFTRSLLGRASRIKRQPDKSRLRDAHRVPRRNSALKQQRQMTYLILSGLLLASVTYCLAVTGRGN